MNKFITKVAKLVLGLSLAAGVGVAVSSNKARKVDAADVLEYKLDGTVTGGSSAYASGSVTQGGLTWTVEANSTMNPWRFGGKDDQIRNCASQAAVSSENITKVLVETGTATCTVNSISLYVGTSEGVSDISSLSKTSSLTSTILEFDRPSGDNWSNRFFTVVFDVSCSSSSNQYIQLKSIEFYKAGSDAPTYAVTYHDTNADSGTAPTGGNYAEGGTVTVAGNTGSLTRDGYDWAGWSLNSDGSGTIYGPTYTATYEMPAAAVDFYPVWVAAQVYTRLESIASIEESGQYVLGLTGVGFHYAGTSSWGNYDLPSNETPLYYTLKKGNGNTTFTAKTTISSTDYYLTVPTSNTFTMSTTETPITLGTTTTPLTGENASFAVANTDTTARHIRVASSGLRSYAGTTGQMAYFYLVGTPSSGDNPTISFTNTNTVSLTMPGTTSATRTVSYANLTGSLSVESLDTEVCTGSLSNIVTGDSETGTKTLTITAVGGGSTTIKVKCVDDNVEASLAVVVAENRTYNKATKLAHIQNNAELILVVDDSTQSTKYAMSTSTGSTTKNRGVEGVTISSGSVSISTTSDVARIRINKVGDYYTLFDKTNSGYYYGHASSNDLYVGSSELPSGNDLYLWSLSFVTQSTYTYTKLECKGGDGRFIQFYPETNKDRFSTFSSSQKKVSMYILSSDFPTETPIATISGDASKTIFIGGSAVYSGTYTPTNATEAIVATPASDKITVGAITMSNGSFTCTISLDSALSEGSYNVTFAPEETTIQSNLVLSVTAHAYSATHDRLDSTNDLTNGLHVVIASTENEVVAGTQNANNISETSCLFDTANDTLCNSLGREFTIYLAKLGTEESDPVGWVFYNNGHYLKAVSGSDNKLSSTDTLDTHCLFSITITDGNAVITCSAVTNGTMGYNGTSHIFSCYGSARNNVELYYNENDLTPTNNQLEVDAFEDAFLFLDGTISTSNENDTGACRNKHYYAYAKAQYLRLTDRSLVSANAISRLTDWATANNEVFNSAAGTFSSNKVSPLINVMGENTNTVAIIVVISMVSVTAIGGYFFLKKRREQN